MVTANERAAKRAKPWKGDKRGGPTPARHIPWPEVIKHHMSVVEGHLRMLEMIQKHTVPQSADWLMITPMVERAQEMLRQHKQATRTFVPAVDTFASVPLGASSASMYPGYSPADHEYGKASMEVGLAISEAKKRGLEVPTDTDCPSYVVGQAHGAKRRMLFQNKDGDEKRTEDGANGSQTNGKKASVEDENDAPPAGGDNPYFVIDTNPTRVNPSVDGKQLPTHPKQPDTEKKSKKRTASERSPAEKTEEKRSKKTKTKVVDEAEAAPANPAVEFDDISAEVDARLKAKEEKRKAKAAKKQEKEEKKRRRDSDVAAATDAGVATEEVDADAAEKPKKKAKKSAVGGGKGEKTSKRGSDNDEHDSEAPKKKRKKEKKAKSGE